MHTGDNMLAIYASEKALRLAERLDEAAAASRAHGIFGRVFGRIGDFEKARENLERSVELARDSDKCEAVRALLTLGYHLEVSEAEYDGASAAYTEALELAVEVGDVPSQVEVHAALAQLALYEPTGTRSSARPRRAPALAEREGLFGKLCFPYVMRGALRWREGNWDERRERLPPRARDRRAGRPLRGRLLGAVLARRRPPRPRQLRRRRGDAGRGRSTSASGPGWSPSRSRRSPSAPICLALGGRPSRRAKPPRRPRTWSSGCITRSAPPPPARPSGATIADPAEGAAALAEARDAWEKLGLPLDAARTEMLRPAASPRTTRKRPAPRPRRPSAVPELGVAHLAARRASWRLAGLDLRRCAA